MEGQEDRLKRFTMFLQELIECPVCFCKMDSTLKQCVNGHGICSVCAMKINNKCPTCSCQVVVQQSTLLGQILEVLPKFCNYSEYGCEAIVFDKDHQTYCEFRPFNCFNRLCKWRGCVKYLLQHLKECYCEKEICQVSSLATQKLLQVRITEHDEPVNTPIIFQNNIFCCRMFVSEDLKPGKIVILYRFYHVPTTKPKCNYYMITHFSKGKLDFKLTFQAKPVTNYSEISERPSDDGIDDIDCILVMQEADLDGFTHLGMSSSQHQYKHTIELIREDIESVPVDKQ